MAFIEKVKAIFPYDLKANLKQWITRDVHEPDFKIFALLSEVPAFCLDIGANRGYSAISMLRQTRRMRVLSIEPNKAFYWGLLLIAVLHPIRFRFRLFAAGNCLERKTLYLPGIETSKYDALGSLDKHEFKKWHILDELSLAGICVGGEVELRTKSVQVIPVDQLALQPSVIKIDVEGYEMQVLQGLTNTLCQNYPMLIIEMNHPQRWVPILKDYGYQFYFYDPTTGFLNALDDAQSTQNLICLHPKSQSEVSLKLFQIVTT